MVIRFDVGRNPSIPVTPPAICSECRGQITVGDRAFPVAAAKVWKKLPGDVTASQSLTGFRRQL